MKKKLTFKDEDYHDIAEENNVCTQRHSHKNHPEWNTEDGDIVSACVYVCACVHLCVLPCACMWKAEDMSAFLHHPLPCSLETGSLTELKLRCRLSGLARALRLCSSPVLR